MSPNYTFSFAMIHKIMDAIIIRAISKHVKLRIKGRQVMLKLTENVPNKLPRKIQERLLKVVVALSRNLMVLHLSLCLQCDLFDLHSNFNRDSDLFGLHLPVLHNHVVDSTHYYWDVPTYPAHVSTRTWPKKGCLDRHTEEEEEEEEEDFNQQFCTYLQQEFGARTTNLTSSL